MYPHHPPADPSPPPLREGDPRPAYYDRNMAMTSYRPPDPYDPYRPGPHPGSAPAGPPDLYRGAPPPAHLPFNQPAPRQRTAIACRYCRRRKIRCSGSDTSKDGRCSNCQRFNQQCIFTPVSSQAQAFVPAQAVYPDFLNNPNASDSPQLFNAYGLPRTHEPPPPPPPQRPPYPAPSPGTPYRYDEHHLPPPGAQRLSLPAASARRESGEYHPHPHPHPHPHGSPASSTSATTPYQYPPPPPPPGPGPGQGGPPGPPPPHAYYDRRSPPTYSPGPGSAPPHTNPAQGYFPSPSMSTPGGGGGSAHTGGGGGGSAPRTPGPPGGSPGSTSGREGGSTTGGGSAGGGGGDRDRGMSIQNMLDAAGPGSQPGQMRSQADNEMLNALRPRRGM